MSDAVIAHIAFVFAVFIFGMMFGEHRVSRFDEERRAFFAKAGARR